MALVYKITNKINNKIYFGLTVRSLEGRWGNHLSAVRQGSKFRFHSAIRKYGVDNWVLEIVEENSDISYIRKLEENLIEEYKTTDNRYGYNAKPGGCGGFIVKPENYDVWKEKKDFNSIGIRNPRFTGITNEEIIEVAVSMCNSLGYIPYQRDFYRKLTEIFDGNFPKSLNGNYRKSIRYENIVLHIKSITGLNVAVYKKSDTHKDKLSKAHIGKSWWYCDELQINKLEFENNLDTKYTWKAGRKKWL